ncbi:hypothetical protein PCANC_01410 [Puccinia coronata f. sp. avenae]|uniref:HAT C-terminal dimerisation domain-containing protein n=1 Tax=Puccinia coronata f. sp. avenae TaxID=200324 RepID=A0A2N5W6B3_9BASI|nr:hypothetical protein PCANC_01410 [Puccinia coronata f. sp. avenae]
MVKELKRLKWPRFKGKTEWIQCFAHVLNLIVQGILWPFGTHKKKEICDNNPVLVDCDASCEEDNLEGQILARGEEPAGLSEEELSNSDSIGKADHNNTESLVKEDIKNRSNEEAGDLYTSSSCKQSLAKDKYFKLANWEPNWIAKAIRLARDMWVSHYKPKSLPVTTPSATPTLPSRPKTGMLSGLSEAAAAQGGNRSSDAFNIWLTRGLVLDGNNPVNPLKWWIQQKRSGNTHGGLEPPLTLRDHSALGQITLHCGGTALHQSHGRYPQVPAKSTRGTLQAVPHAVPGIGFWQKTARYPGVNGYPGPLGHSLLATKTPPSCCYS